MVFLDMLKTNAAPSSGVHRGTGSEWPNNLVSVSQTKDQRFIPVPAEYLQAYWKRRRGETAGNTDSRNAGQICRHGINVVQVHGQRIVELLADKKGRRRRRRSKNRVAAGKGIDEVLLD